MNLPMSTLRRSSIPDERPLATLTVGGILTVADLNPFRRAIERSEASLAIDGSGVDELDIMEIVNQRHCLTLYSRKVSRHGDLVSIQNFCLKQNLTYRRVTRGGAFTDTTECFWRPGLVIPHKFQINFNTGDVLYPMTFLLALRTHKVNLNDWVLYFKENFPTEIPPLEVTS